MYLGVPENTSDCYQRPPPRLLALDRLEQRLEVALAEALRAMPARPTRSR
jgi:hypothetical protein